MAEFLLSKQGPQDHTARRWGYTKASSISVQAYGRSGADEHFTPDVI